MRDWFKPVTRRESESALTSTSLRSRACPSGEALIAQALYEEDADSKKAREVMAAHVRAMNANTGYESGRPTKKDRREIERLKGKD